jgi:transposase
MFTRGIHIVFLPPYSPDLNPIESAFGCMKAWIRRNNVEIRDAMESPDKDEGIAALTMAIMESVTPQKANGWFRDSGYY